MAERGETELVKVLGAIDTYLTNDDHNFHSRVRLIYCPACESIEAEVGDYRTLAGRDCNGSHYKTTEEPNHCNSCDTKKYKLISPKDITSLEGIPGEQILKAIATGIDKLDFPSLYNEELPKISRKWKRLSKKEKIRQISSLKSKGKQIHEARKTLGQLEESVGI